MRKAKTFRHVPKLRETGWTLVSAEDRHAQYPGSFLIPSLADRSSLEIGHGAQLLFEIESRGNGEIVDRGVDRMWVIIKKVGDSYVGVLDSDPGLAENLDLVRGDLITFFAEHVCAIDRPSREHVLASHAADFFGGAD